MLKWLELSLLAKIVLPFQANVQNVMELNVSNVPLIPTYTLHVYYQELGQLFQQKEGSTFKVKLILENVLNLSQDVKLVWV
jgi:hypothetical protein